MTKEYLHEMNNRAMWLIVSASDWTLKAEWRNFLTQIEKEGDAWPLYTCLRFTRTLSDLRVFGKGTQPVKSEQVVNERN